MNKFFKLLLISVSALWLFSSCENNISDKTDNLTLLILHNALSNRSSSSETEQYGSLTITQSVSRALDIGEINRATVTVSGYGMSDISKDAVINDKSEKAL